MRVTDEQAAAELTAAGYKPLEPYPGKLKKPWRAVCATCGTQRTPSLDAVRHGARCRHKGTEHYVLPTLPDSKVIADYRSGKTLGELAAAYGVSVNHIRNLMDRHNEPRREPPKGRPAVLNEEQAAAAVKRHQQGESAWKIAADLGVSRTSVASAIAAGGGKPRTHDEARELRWARFNALPLEEIAQRRAAGEAWADLAAHYGASVRTLQDKLRKWKKEQ